MGPHFVGRTKLEYNTRFPGGTRREGIGKPVGTSIGEVVWESAGKVVGITARGMVGNAWHGCALEQPNEADPPALSTFKPRPCLTCHVCARGGCVSVWLL